MNETKKLKLDFNIEAEKENSMLYSILDRGTYKPGPVKEQAICDPDGLYDKIELSLTTGQREKRSDIEEKCVVTEETPNKHREKKDNKEEEREKQKKLEEMYAVVNNKKKNERNMHSCYSR